MQKTLVIGDIHGCYAELQTLLDKAGLGQDDRILAVGDVVDRGPETPQVVDFFQDTPNAITLMGNHERKHVRAARHEVQLALSQRISQIQLGPAYPDALAWMATLPLYAELTEAIVVHGYFEPGIPLAAQHPSVICGTMGGEKLLQQRYDRPWYELYDGEKALIVGHKNYNHTAQPFVYRERVFGLDTECVLGKALTGLLLPEFRMISVPSRDNQWLQVRRAYSIARAKPAPPRPAIPWDESQNQALRELFQALLQANRRVLESVEQTPGYAELAPRQQAMRYAGRVGRGVLADLLHLARLGKLNLELLRRIIKDPARVPPLLEQIANDFSE